MGDFDSIGRCTIGTTGLQLVDYSHHEDKIIQQGSGLAGRAIGKKIEIKVSAYVSGATPAELQTNLWAAKAALAGSGQDFRIYCNGLSEAQVSILAARMVNGGPHIDFEIKEQGEAGALRKNIDFTIFGETVNVGSGSGGEKEDTVTVDEKEFFTEKFEKKADQLRVFTRMGELRGPNLYVRIEGLFTGFEGRFNPGSFATKLEYELGTFVALASNGVLEEQGDVLKYTMTAEEMRDQLPGINGTVVAIAVDGTGSYSSDRDEQHRFTETYEFDFLIRGNYFKVLELIRSGQLPADRVPLRESISFTSFRERRLRCSFVYLRAADGGTLANWTASFRISKAADVYEVKRYPGLPPILVRKAKGFSTLTQSGTAVGIGAFPQAPEPIFPANLLEEPEISKSDMNDVEKQIEWSYVMAFEGDEPNPSLLKRPS